MNGVAEQCATSASAPEHVSADGPTSPPIEPPSSLVDALFQLAQVMLIQANAMDRNNHLLAQIVAQNADLIDALVNDDEDDDSERDLMGNPV